MVLWNLITNPPKKIVDKNKFIYMSKEKIIKSKCNISMGYSDIY